MVHRRCFKTSPPIKKKGDYFLSPGIVAGFNDFLLINGRWNHWLWVQVRNCTTVPAKFSLGILLLEISLCVMCHEAGCRYNNRHHWGKSLRSSWSPGVRNGTLPVSAIVSFTYGQFEQSSVWIIWALASLIISPQSLFSLQDNEKTTRTGDHLESVTEKP